MKKLWPIVFLIAFTISCKKEVSEFQAQNFIKFFGNGLSSAGLDLVETNGGYIITGSDNTSENRNQLFVIKTNRAGNALWQKHFGTPFDEEGKIIKVVDEAIYIAGVSTSNSTGISSSFILHLNMQGDSIGYHTIGDGQYSLIVHDFLVSNSSVVVVGESFEHSSSQSDYFVAKYSLQGDEIWSRTFIADGNQTMQKIFIKGDGNLVTVGANNSVINSELSHITVVEFNPQGLPVHFFNLPAQNNQFFGDALFVDGNLIIAYNELVQAEYSASFVKLNSSSYSTLWHMQSEIQCKAKTLAFSSSGIITLCGEKSNAIHLYQLNTSGSITLFSEELKNLSGFVESAIATSDKGWAFIGTTSPEYGSVIQLIKTDKDLYLFEH